MLTPMNRSAVRRRIRHRIRRKVEGTSERPRVAVFRTSRHIYVQVIDDSQGRTLAAASTRDPDVRGRISDGSNVAAAKVVGGVIVEKLKEAGVERVVFDRGGYLYHGRVRALAEEIRSGGVTL